MKQAMFKIAVDNKDQAQQEVMMFIETAAILIIITKTTIAIATI